MKDKINKKFGMVSLGCPKNLVDTEVTIGLLEQAGYIFTQQLEDARILLVNTCSFIDKSKQESIETILELAEYKEKGVCEKLLVLGCLSQLYKNELCREIPEIDAVIGSADFYQVNKILNELEQRNRIESVHKPIFLYDHKIARHLCTLPHTAYVKISEGCDHVCSFCIIPRLRGKQRSRPIESIVQEIEQLGQTGVKEINLIAQDLTDYGRDIYGEYRLVELLKQLSEIDSIRWIRLLYTYPSLVSDELIQLISLKKRICKYIDIPLQHINDDILHSMRRGIDSKSSRDLIKKLRLRIPGIAIRTTFIVGYPGETEEQFNELMDFVEESEFDWLGAFTYSREEYTLSARQSGQIPDDIKQDRLNRLMRLQEKISCKKQSEWIGKTIEVLVDKKINKSYGNFIGRSERHAPDIDGVIYIKNKSVNGIQPGQLMDSRIQSVMGYDLISEIGKQPVYVLY